MKRIITMLLMLCMLSTSAYASGKSAEIPYEDSTLTLSFESAEVVDGELKVRVSGFEEVNAATLANGMPALVNAELNGSKVYISKVHCGLDGVYEYTIPMDEMPEIIYIYKDGDEANRQILWDSTDVEEVPDSAPGFVIEVEEERTAKETEEPTANGIPDSSLIPVAQGNDFVHAPAKTTPAEIEFTAPSDKSVYIWMENFEDSSMSFSIFLTKGRTKAFAIPTGTYELQYAYGDTWYGPEYLFGSDTRFIAVNGELDFTVEYYGNSVSYSSWSIPPFSTDPEYYDYTYEIYAEEFNGPNRVNLLAGNSADAAPVDDRNVENGQILVKPTYRCCCPLSVSVMGEDTYYVYLEYQGEPEESTEKRLSTGRSPSQPDIAFIVEANGTADVEVPIGVYKLYYCSGKTWDGIANKFGADTAYASSDDLLAFYTTEEQYTGHSLQLWRQENGNMSDYEIEENEFPG